MDLLPCGWKLNCRRLPSILKYASFCWLSLAPESEDTVRNRLLGFPHVFQQCRKPLICTCRNFRSLGRRNNSGCAKQGMGERLRLTTYKHLRATVYVYIYMYIYICIYVYIYIYVCVYYCVYIYILYISCISMYTVYTMFSINYPVPASFWSIHMFPPTCGGRASQKAKEVLNLGSNGNQYPENPWKPMVSVGCHIYVSLLFFGGYLFKVYHTPKGHQSRLLANM